MKLADLDPQFLRYDDGDHVNVNTLAEADGIRFLCPQCFGINGGRTGTHSMVRWFEGKVPPEAIPEGRWTTSGSGYHDLSFILGDNKRSLQVVNDCKLRAFLADGEITWKRPGRT